MPRPNRRQDKATKAIAKEAFLIERKETVTRNRAPDDLDPSLIWFLVYTSPRGEARAQAGLEEAGCQVFWPSSRKVITQGQRRQEFDVGTYPRYLFATGPLLTADPDADRQRFFVKGRPVSCVRDIEGVQGVVGTSRGWLRVPGRAIQAIADYQNSVAPPPPKQRYQSGASVRILGGPFADLHGTIVGNVMMDEAEARILIDILGGQVPATIGVPQLEAA